MILFYRYQVPESSSVHNDINRRRRRKPDEFRKREELEEWVHKLHRGEIADKR